VRSARHLGGSPQLASVALLVVIGVVVACSSGPAVSPTPSAPASASPAGSGGPKPTQWPTPVVEGTIALGAAHSDFTPMMQDLQGAIDSEDPARIADVIDRVLQFLTENEKNIPRLQAYPGTKDLGDKLAPGYRHLIEAATQVKTGLASGDGQAVTDGLKKFFDAELEYVQSASDLSVAVERAIFMKRQLLR
jgi:hypothetical protein